MFLDMFQYVLRYVQAEHKLCSNMFKSMCQYVQNNYITMSLKSLLSPIGTAYLSQSDVEALLCSLSTPFYLFKLKIGYVLKRFFPLFYLLLSSVFLSLSPTYLFKSHLRSILGFFYSFVGKYLLKYLKFFKHSFFENLLLIYFSTSFIP